MRVALGVSYRGQAYHGWQSQADRRTVQDGLEAGLSAFAAEPIRTHCAGRTDTGVHGLNQVVHFDTTVQRDAVSWVRGSNRYLPADIAIQWCRFPSETFHARYAARGRRYSYLLLQSPVRPALEAGMVGWVFRALDEAALQAAASRLVGEHDFSAFRSAQCQAASPIKTLHSVRVSRRGALTGSYWRFDFDASAYLHHMVRNLMGSLLAVGTGRQPVGWVQDVLRSRDRRLAAPTFSADGLYFLGPYYDAEHDIPQHTAAMDWLP